MSEHPSPSFSPLLRRGESKRGDLDPVHHIRRDLLSRPVRSYADNLEAELHNILRQYEVRTPFDFERLAREKKISEAVVRKYNNLLIRLSEVVRSGKLPESELDHIVEYHEHTLDLREVLTSSRSFYDSHNLQTLSDALPDTLDALSDAQRERIQFAMEQGFTRALILPSPDLLKEHLDDITEECANQPSDKLAEENDQYAKSYLENKAKSFPFHNRPSPLGHGSGQAYLLLYSPGNIPEETNGKTAEKLITLFQTKHWNSLTIPEYLLLQRIEAEQRGNHSFDAFSTEPKDSNWSFLLDSRTSSVIVLTYWSPGSRQVRVNWHDLQYSHPLLGARPTVVVEL